MELVALRVKIGLKPDGSHKFPDFGSLPYVKSRGVDWAMLIDKVGSGWQYDKCCGHKEVDAESPNFGEWIGQVLVPEQFAVEAVTQFPDKCQEVDPDEAERWYEERAAVNQPDYDVDQAAIAAIQARQAAGLTLEQKELDALDPDKPQRGVKRNERKRMAKVLEKMGATLKRKPGQVPLRVRGA